MLCIGLLDQKWETLVDITVLNVIENGRRTNQDFRKIRLSEITDLTPCGLN